MITENYSTVVPAYGRDYRNAKDATKDFLDGKDFDLRSYNSSGYCSVRDFQPGVKVNIRYSKLMKVTVVTVPNVGQYPMP